MIKVKVLRILNGGEYMPGDIRDNLTKADALRLASTGAVEIDDEQSAAKAPEPAPQPEIEPTVEPVVTPEPEAKAEEEHENKAEPAPQNKAVSTPKKRGGK